MGHPDRLLFRLIKLLHPAHQNVKSSSPRITADETNYDTACFRTPRAFPTSAPSRATRCRSADTRQEHTETRSHESQRQPCGAANRRRWLAGQQKIGRGQRSLAPSRLERPRGRLRFTLRSSRTAPRHRCTGPRRRLNALGQGRRAPRQVRLGVCRRDVRTARAGPDMVGPRAGPVAPRVRQFHVNADAVGPTRSESHLKRSQ